MNSISIHKQKGAVLVVSMVLLMVLTMLAISTMSTASLEVTMAGNEQYRQNAFQLAETGNDLFLASTLADTDCIDTDNPGICDIPLRPVNEMGGSIQAANTITDENNCPGSSVETMTAINFEVVALGQTATRGAASQHSQGWFVCVPKPKINEL